MVEKMILADIPNDCTVRNIRRGKGGRSKWVYAELYSPEGELMISATLDYIAERLKSSLKENENV